MNDKELLELAAKAAGIELQWERDPAYIQERHVAYIQCGWIGQPALREWNPLREDGDALRLLVAIGAGLNTSNPKTLCFSQTDDVYENHNSDKYAATRRAIVRAAAEIGKAM